MPIVHFVVRVTSGLIIKLEIFVTKKAQSPIFSIVLGIIIVPDKFEQSAKACFPIVLICVYSNPTIEEKALKAKAESPIYFSVLLLMLPSVNSPVKYSPFSLIAAPSYTYGIILNSIMIYCFC